MLHYTVCVCDILITRYHYFTHCGIYLDTMFNQSFMKTFMSWFVMRVCQGMCSFFQTALRESRWVEQPEGDCGIEAGGVEAWKEQWEPVGLGGFGVSNEKLPEPQGGSAEFRPDPDPGGLKIVPGNVGMAMRRCGLRRSAETCLLSCHVVSP